MSLQGNATADVVLRGKINGLDTLTVDAYAVAVRNGFDGTVDEWLASLKGANGDPGRTPVKGVDYFTEADIEELLSRLTGTATAAIAHITLYAAKWQGAASPYSQVITVDGITEYSKVDINPSVEQLAVFHQKDIALVAENEDGVVTVYCIGQKPTADYTMQITITEVLANG